MLKRIAFLLLFIINSSLLILHAQPPRSYTSSEILLQLKKLNTVGSVLYIAAHPDDENTRLIAYLANEKYLRTGYLSLTRGDGGQNLIGPEQGIELGVIRTQELLAARRIDGGEQFFTRAYDFGFSKSPEETLRKWNKDSILSDMVWVIRNFRPDIIITRFATDGSGGHGHHTTSAILAEEAFDAAADPTKFPEQLKYVEVWKTRRLFYNSAARFFNPNADLSKLLKLDVGVYNPLLGKSYGEIAAESRSMHKSQGFGSARQRGESFEYFKPIKGDTTGLKDIFDGIDLSWKRVKGGKLVESLILDAIHAFDPSAPNKVVESLVEAKLLLEKKYSNEHRYHKRLIEQILMSATGTYVEWIANDYNYALGAKFNYYTFSLRRNPEVGAPRPALVKKDSFPYYSGNEISSLYWLKKPIHNSQFQIENRFNMLDNANQKPLSMESMSFKPNNPYYFDTLMGTQTNNTGIYLNSLNGVQYKWVDPEKGELYRPLVITPPVMMNTTNKVLLFNDNSPKQYTIIVKAGKDNVKGELKIASKDKLNTYDEIKVDPQNPKVAEIRLTSFQYEPLSSFFELAKKGDEKSFTFYFRPANNESINDIKFVAVVDGIEYTKGIKEIKYDHIPVQTLFPEAEVKLVKLDVKTKSKRIGYIPGAGDEVAPSLSQLGYEVITLTDDMLAKESLSQFDAIVTGVRAYNTNEKLASFKPKLMEYVNNGGNLIVQYNTNSFVGPFKADIGPYPFKITRDRITDEEAKVVMELPNHPVFNTPNKITDKDFEGWIQERSIYHAGDWDSNYVAPISMADPNEKASKGALLIARYGIGNFIYTGLVFFRELPAGVPGAYRLMVNLIELGK